MLDRLKTLAPLKRIQKSMTYSRWRQYLPMPEDRYVDDSGRIEDAEVIRIDWPKGVEKPRVGIVRDRLRFPRWTKYRRFLENNSFPYGICDIHSHDWIHNVENFDVIIGVVSSESSHLEEVQKKYYFLEKFLGKQCFPSSTHVLLYENKCFEAYLSEWFGLPFARTYISYDREDALASAETLKYPLVSKINPSSAGMGVQLLRTPKQARKIIRRAFSNVGRKVHVPYFRQKNYVYFQEYIPNDGYDIRVILVDKMAFGYYRRVLRGDIRASGMGLVEKRALPEEAIRTAERVYTSIRSPLLAVDMVHALDGSYWVIEFSPFFLWESPEQLVVDGVPGVYMIDDSGAIRFQKGRYWVDELALREFLLCDYLPAVSVRPAGRP